MHFPARLARFVLPLGAMAGYSGTPLPKKLGIRDGHQVVLLDAPERFDDTLGELPEGVVVRTALRGAASVDVIVLFVANKAALAKQFAAGKAALSPDGGYWIAWPKKASGVPTDLTEDVIRADALAAGLVDNKVCAIDETWSGLRLVYRVADRAAVAGQRPTPKNAAAKKAPARKTPAKRR